jgi:hypothetical protein
LFPARLHQASTPDKLRTVGARASDWGTCCRLGDKCSTAAPSAAGEAAPLRRVSLSVEGRMEPQGTVRLAPCPSAQPWPVLSALAACCALSLTRPFYAGWRCCTCWRSRGVSARSGPQAAGPRPLHGSRLTRPPASRLGTRRGTAQLARRALYSLCTSRAACRVNWRVLPRRPCRPRAAASRIGLCAP